MSDKAILYVGTCSSRCGACGRAAFPHEKTHAKEAGYNKDRGDGCGVEWTHITSEYEGPRIKQAVKDMRPDLTFI